MDKDTTLICTIGETIRIFHSSEAAKDMYENKYGNHEVVVINFTDDDFKRLTRKMNVV